MELTSWFPSVINLHYTLHPLSVRSNVTLRLRPSHHMPEPELPVQSPTFAATLDKRNVRRALSSADTRREEVNLKVSSERVNMNSHKLETWGFILCHFLRNLRSWILASITPLILIDQGLLQIIKILQWWPVTVFHLFFSPRCNSDVNLFCQVGHRPAVLQVQCPI